MVVVATYIEGRGEACAKSFGRRPLLVMHFQFNYDTRGGLPNITSSIGWRCHLQFGKCDATTMPIEKTFNASLQHTSEMQDARKERAPIFAKMNYALLPKYAKKARKAVARRRKTTGIPSCCCCIGQPTPGTKAFSGWTSQRSK